jgi:hypothetical protein
MGNWQLLAISLSAIGLYLVVRTILLRRWRNRVEERFRRTGVEVKLAAALAIRQVGFVYMGVVALIALIVALVVPTQLTTLSRVRLNILTALTFAVATAMVAGSFFLYVPSYWQKIAVRNRAKGRPVSFSKFAKGIATLGPAVTFQPILGGYILELLSGEAWLFLIFLPISIAGAYLFWKRSNEVLRELAASDVFD